ncbi:MAG: exonuclease SbcCD subunit D [Bacteroidota bacterium]
MKILHVADIHIGYETHGKLLPGSGVNSRLLDFRRAFDFVVQRGLDEDIDLFLFCGDAYRTADPTPTQQQHFASALQPIIEAGIPVAMIIGNHDHPVSFGKSSSVDIYPIFLKHVHIFRKPDKAVIETKSGPVQLIALPWPIRSMILTKDEHRKKSPAELKQFIEELYVRFLNAAAQELDPALPTVVAGHFTVQGASLGGSERSGLIAHEATFTTGQLTPAPVDYVALGHIHKFQDLNPNGTPVVYSSSIERISFREWADPRGFVLVDIEANGGQKTTQYEFVETPARRFIPVQLDLTEADDPTQALLDEISTHEIEEAIVRVRYKVSEEKASQVDTQQIRRALAGAHSIAAVERLMDDEVRERRTSINRDTTLKEALNLYIDQHEKLHGLREELVTRALELEDLLDAPTRGNA